MGVVVYREEEKEPWGGFLELSVPGLRGGQDGALSAREPRSLEDIPFPILPRLSSPRIVGPSSIAFEPGHNGAAT